MDPRTGRSYALKRIVKRTASDERFFRQTENEFVHARMVDHPAVRKVFDIFRIRRFFRVHELHMLMEIVYGQSLEVHRPANPLTAVRIFIKVCEGLDAMHAAGLAHADVKPNNILIGPSGQVKLIDLGQSCPLGTVKQRIQGTPDYIAPEQVFRRPIDRRTDVFNIGATLYWVLTGAHVPTVLPKAPPGREIALASATRLVPPDELDPDVPPALSRLVVECVQTNPLERPADMKVLKTRLETTELILRNAAAPVAPAASVSQADEADEPTDPEWAFFDDIQAEADTVDLLNSDQP